MTKGQLVEIRALATAQPESPGPKSAFYLCHYDPHEVVHALLNEVERLSALRDDLLAWSQRFSDLVGEDGITEASRCDAFAKLYDAAKASGKLVRE
jgi:hypothetical protein